MKSTSSRQWQPRPTRYLSSFICHVLTGPLDASATLILIHMHDPLTLWKLCLSTKYLADMSVLQITYTGYTNIPLAVILNQSWLMPRRARTGYLLVKKAIFTSHARKSLSKRMSNYNQRVQVQTQIVTAYVLTRWGGKWDWLRPRLPFLTSRHYA